MTQYFLFEDPEQLKEVSALTKEGSCKTLAAMWSVARRKGFTTWDGKIGAMFETHGNARKACVYRLVADENQEICGLKYTPALRWCRENLTVHVMVKAEKK